MITWKADATAMMILIFAAVMFYGFQWYAGALQAWPRMRIFWKILTLPGVLTFGACDVLFNVTLGSLMYWEAPFRNGCLTFSQRTEYWYHESGWRKIVIADNWASFLNSIIPGHIR